MKPIFYCLLVLCFFSCTEKKGNPFLVEGNVRNSDARLIYLEQLPAGGDQRPIIVDSATLTDKGTFRLQTTTAEEGLYGIRIAGSRFPLALLVSDSRKISLDIDVRNPSQYAIKGSEASKGLLEFSNELNRQFSIIYEAGQELDSLGRIQPLDSTSLHTGDSLATAQAARYETASADIKNYTADYIEKSKSPVLILYAYEVYQNTAQRFNIKGFNRIESNDLMGRAASRFPDSKLLAEEKKKLPSITASEINLPDTSGQKLALSSFRGKYVLVDFWASWCRPCRMENPNVVAAYNRFKDKNFTILGVSLDRSKDAWVKAIQDDGLSWNHVSDLQYWDSEVVPLYGFNSIPYNILVDPQGKIVAEDLRGPELAATLEKLLK